MYRLNRSGPKPLNPRVATIPPGDSWAKSVEVRTRINAGTIAG